jgi:hypothetical protein
MRRRRAADRNDGVVRRFAVAGLDEAARRGGRQHGLRAGPLDETSQVRQGSATAGVKRQYLGCVGKVANAITTVVELAAPLPSSSPLVSAAHTARLRHRNCPPVS